MRELRLSRVVGIYLISSAWMSDDFGSLDREMDMFVAALLFIRFILDVPGNSSLLAS